MLPNIVYQWQSPKPFVVFSGIIYDVIVEPPSIGSTTDEKGNSKPVSVDIVVCYSSSTFWLTYLYYTVVLLWQSTWG